MKVVIAEKPCREIALLLGATERRKVTDGKWISGNLAFGHLVAFYAGRLWN
jgi:hypothetical protein